jgi:L-alanine-DL-glutamate epimerase-like enolase superfamily enzyme
MRVARIRRAFGRNVALANKTIVERSSAPDPRWTRWTGRSSGIRSITCCGMVERDAASIPFGVDIALWDIAGKSGSTSL